MTVKKIHKILFFILITAVNILPAEKKIVDLKPKRAFGGVFFYLADDKKECNYGYFMFTKYFKTITAVDLASEPFKDRISMGMLKSFFISYDKYFASSLWMVYFAVCSTLCLGFCAYPFYLAYIDSNNPIEFYRVFPYALGGAFAGLGAVFLAGFFIMLPFMIKYYKLYKSRKLDILNELNKVSLIDNRDKIRFSFSLDLCLKR